MYISPRVSMNWGGHAGPSLGQVDTRGGQPHLGAKSAGPWRVRLLEGGKGSTDFTMSVWPRIMASRPHGVLPTVFCHGNVTAKLRNRPWDTINTTLRSPLEYTYSTVGYPLVKALVL
jgi:hypothetical protein